MTKKLIISLIISYSFTVFPSAKSPFLVFLVLNQQKSHKKEDFRTSIMKICDSANIPLKNFHKKKLTEKQSSSIKLQITRGQEAVAIIMEKESKKIDSNGSTKNLNDFYKKFCIKLKKKS